MRVAAGIAILQKAECVLEAKELAARFAVVETNFQLNSIFRREKPKRATVPFESSFTTRAKAGLSVELRAASWAISPSI